MAFEKLQEELINQLKTYGANQIEIQKWQAQWIDAVKSGNRGDPLPCPKCFLDGLGPKRLTPLPLEGTSARVKCVECKTYYHYADE
jgi:hypothetical protein